MGNGTGAQLTPSGKEQGVCHRVHWTVLSSNTDPAGTKPERQIFFLRTIAVTKNLTPRICETHQAIDIADEASD